MRFAVLLFILFLVGCRNNAVAPEHTTELIEYETITFVPEIVYDAGRDIIVLETQNFALRYYGNDDQVIVAIADALESSFERITGILGVVPPGPTHVYIHASQEDFHHAIGMPGLGERAVGVSMVTGEIILASPNNAGPVHDFNSMIKIAVHEFVHTAARVLSFRTTAMHPHLSEGLAMYFANQYETVADTITQMRSNQAIPSVDRIIGMTAGEGVYQVGFAFIQFIVAEFGYDELVALYSNPREFVQSNAGLNDMWMDFLYENY